MPVTLVKPIMKRMLKVLLCLCRNVRQYVNQKKQVKSPEDSKSQSEEGEKKEEMEAKVNGEKVSDNWAVFTKILTLKNNS